MTQLPALAPTDRRLVVPVENVSEGEAAAIKVAFTDLREKPDWQCAIDTQLIFGETVKVYQTRGDWALVQADLDRYVGWIEAGTLAYDPQPATHLVCVPRTFFYPEPDLKLPHKGMRSLGSALRVAEETEVRGTRYAVLQSGEAVIARHIRAIGIHDPDYVSVAETLLRTPYLWAGTSAFGLDCSGLIKLAMFMCGHDVLRDSDMQAASIGEEIDPGPNFERVERGDLVFWRGHVAICQGRSGEGQQRIIHANGHTMDVASEPLQSAMERIAYLYERPIGVRRPTQ